MNQETKVQVKFPSGEIMIAEFTWEAIDYIMDRYGSMADAHAVIAKLSKGNAGVTKENMKCLIDFITAMFITNNPDITPEIIKKKIPYNQLNSFSKIIEIIIQAGQAEVDANFQVIPMEGQAK